MSWVQELEIWSGQNAQNCFLYQIRCPHQSIFRSGIDFSASQDLHLSALKIADIFLTKWYNKNTILAPSFNIVLVSFECKGQFFVLFCAIWSQSESHINTNMQSRLLLWQASLTAASGFSSYITRPQKIQIDLSGEVSKIFSMHFSTVNWLARGSWRKFIRSIPILGWNSILDIWYINTD